MSQQSDPLVLRVRTIAYQRVAWLDITYGEYKPRCGCQELRCARGRGEKLRIWLESNPGAFAQ